MSATSLPICTTTSIAYSTDTSKELAVKLNEPVDEAEGAGVRKNACESEALRVVPNGVDDEDCVALKA